MATAVGFNLTWETVLTPILRALPIRISRARPSKHVNGFPAAHSRRIAPDGNRTRDRHGRLRCVSVAAVAVVFCFYELISVTMYTYYYTV